MASNCVPPRLIHNYPIIILTRIKRHGTPIGNKYRTPENPLIRQRDNNINSMTISPRLINNSVSLRGGSAIKTSGFNFDNLCLRKYKPRVNQTGDKRKKSPAVELNTILPG